MNIKVISNEIVKPSRPTPKHLQFLRASLFDHANSPTLMPLIIFFDSHNSTAELSTRQVLDRLKGSLPDTLSVFYPLAGRIQDPNHFNCNDKGVPYVQVIVDTTINDVIYKEEVSQLDKLVPSYGNEGFTTLMLAIQVNIFSCGGLAIGLKMNHAISDAVSYYMFFNTWTYIANNDKKDHKVIMWPSFEISKLFPPPMPKNICGTHVYANHNSDLIEHRPVAKWFAFDRVKLNALRSKLLSYTKSGSITNINDGKCKIISQASLASVLCAFIWCRFKVACHGSADNTPHLALQAVNIRSRLSLGDEQTYYFGNVVVNAIAKLPMKPSINKHSNESMMGDFLVEMKKSIAQVSNDSFIKKMSEGKEDLRFVMDHFERETKGEIVSIGFSNQMSLPVYEADFGWGKPTWVTTATLMFKNVVILLPASASRKHIIAYLNLSPEDMAKLENDIEFTSFVSKLSYVNSKL